MSTQSLPCCCLEHQFTSCSFCHFVLSTAETGTEFVDFSLFQSESVNSLFNNFWEVSNMIIDKIEGNPRYL